MTTFLMSSHPRPVAEAFRFHLDIGKARVQERIHSLNILAKEAFAEMPHVRLHTPMKTALSSGMICFDVDGYTPNQVVDELLRHEIIASTTPYRNSCARLAPGLINNEEEVQRTIKVVTEM
jgi:isopenicillin-N epimerase